MKRAMMAGVVYFTLVFGAGFVLGTIRTLWFTPRWGARAAEIAETPFMLALSYAAARWVVRRLRVPPALRPRLAMGFLALALLVAAEIALVRALRGLTLSDYIASRDPVSGNVYLLALLAFALIPILLGRAKGGVTT